METKIYTHTNFTLYCPRCKREIWDGEPLKTDRIHCFHCGIDITIDYQRGVTRIEEVLNGAKVGQL